MTHPHTDSGVRADSGPTEADFAWLESIRDKGHCGEGTLELRERARWNDRIDRIVAAGRAALQAEDAA